MRDDVDTLGQPRNRLIQLPSSVMIDAVNITKLFYRRFLLVFGPRNFIKFQKIGQNSHV
jgi:hypothetical protein